MIPPGIDFRHNIIDGELIEKGSVKKGNFGTVSTRLPLCELITILEEKQVL